MAVRSYNGREVLADFNRNFENSPGGVPTTTNGRWIDGTAGGSVADNTYKWGVNSTNSSGSFAAVFDSTVKYSGSNSLKISTTGINSNCAVSTALSNTYAALVIGGIVLRNNRTFTYSYRMKTNYVSGDSNGGAYLQMTYRNNSGGSIASITGTVVKTTTDWTYYSGTFTVPPGTPYWITVMPIIVGSSGTGTLIMDAWFDDISLTEVLPARTLISTPRTTATNRVATRDMGTALSFDGVGNYVEVPDANIPASTFQNGFTVASWIKPKSLGGGTNGFIFDKSTSTGAGNGFHFRVRDLNRIAGGVTNGNQVSASSAFVFNRPAFVVMTVTKNGSASQINFFANGLQTGTANQVGGDLAGITTTNALRIGNRSAATDRGFDGIIDEPRIWTRPLTATEIANMYFNNVVPTSGLIEQLLFNETAGLVALDSSGNGNDGTLTGATYVTDPAYKTRTLA